LDKPFVLLADDNEATCTLITALLQSEFVVEVASDGGEAIEKLKSRQYAAILLDLRMPHVDGYAVLDSLSTERADLLSRVIILTAAVDAREMQRLGGYPVQRIIAKPFEVDVLFHAVRQCAGGDDASTMRVPIISGGMLFLLAEVLRRV
jgi:CheY-like chemotaxis protein